MNRWFNRWYPIGAVGLWSVLVLSNSSFAADLSVGKVGNLSVIKVGDRVLKSTSANIENARILNAGIKSDVASWSENSIGGVHSYYSIRKADGSWSAPHLAQTELLFRDRAFDPVTSAPASMELQARPSNDPSKKLFVVQFHTQSLDTYRQELTKLGAEVHQYLPNQAHIVRATEATAAQIKKLSFVRWVGYLTSNFKSDDKTKRWMRINASPDEAKRFNVVVLNRADRNALMAKVVAAGAKVAHPNEGSLLFEVDVNHAQLEFLLSQSETLWMDPWTEIGEDIDKARTLGGADYLSTLATDDRYTGIGIRGHVMEGIDPAHPDFGPSTHRKAPISVDKVEVSDHGHCTYGIVFGNGTKRKEAKGMLPNAQGYYTPYSYVYSATAGNKEAGSRYALVKKLINEHQVMFQTASWGYSTTEEYDARSLEMDDIIFANNIPITQSQSNTGTRYSRPQAWAKNIISVGATYHYDNTDFADDRWDGGASIGPATDGRIKPDISAFYDRILTTAVNNSYTEDFGGTSGATPIVAGHVGLTIEMWTNGEFGNKLMAPATERFKNRPYFTTVKALLINLARQWQFKGESDDHTRVHQGWGFPDLKNMYENRTKMLVVNADAPLKALETKSYTVNVKANTPELKATMVFADPPGNLTSKVTRVNDLSLKVTSPDGTSYWGNVGLLSSMYSEAGGEANTVDPVENVFVENPMAGAWKVEVVATEVNQDAYLATTEADASFSLVVSGISR